MSRETEKKNCQDFTTGIFSNCILAVLQLIRYIFLFLLFIPLGILCHLFQFFIMNSFRMRNIILFIMCSTILSSLILNLSYGHTQVSSRLHCYVGKIWIASHIWNTLLGKLFIFDFDALISLEDDQSLFQLPDNISFGILFHTLVMSNVAPSPCTVYNVEYDVDNLRPLKFKRWPLQNGGLLSFKCMLTPNNNYIMHILKNIVAFYEV